MTQNDWIGRTIADTDLRVDELITRSSTAEIYRVTSTSIGRTFCAKFVNTGQDARRWRREVEALAKLHHPHIVKLFRSIELADQIVVVQDWAGGRSLANIVAERGPLPIDDVRVLAEQLASALEVVHGAGLLHRNINPAHVFIDELPSGQPFCRLLDFGVARSTVDNSTTEFMGDPNYAAPEQFADQPLSAATDTYQLGCTLFFALTGAPPFPSATPSDTMNSHLYLTAPRASDLVPRLRNTAFDDLLVDLLDKSPQMRPSDAVDILDRLRGPSSARTNPLPPPRPPAPATLTSVGEDESVVSVTGQRVTVRAAEVVSHFDTTPRVVTALHSATGRVMFGTSAGHICELDVTTGKIGQWAQFARGDAITHVALMQETAVAVDTRGEIYTVTRDGRYQRVPKQSEVGIDAVAGALSDPTFAILRGNMLEIYRNASANRVAVVELDFEAQHLAVAPDGYVVAVMGGQTTRLLSGLDGSRIHEYRMPSHATAITFAGPKVVALRSGPDGTQQLFAIS